MTTKTLDEMIRETIRAEVNAAFQPIFEALKLAMNAQNALGQVSDAIAGMALNDAVKTVKRGPGRPRKNPLVPPLSPSPVLVAAETPPRKKRKYTRRKPKAHPVVKMVEAAKKAIKASVRRPAPKKKPAPKAKVLVKAKPAVKAKAKPTTKRIRPSRAKPKVPANSFVAPRSSPPKTPVNEPVTVGVATTLVPGNGA